MEQEFLSSLAGIQTSIDYLKTHRNLDEKTFGRKIASLQRAIEIIKNKISKGKQKKIKDSFSVFKIGFIPHKFAWFRSGQLPEDIEINMKRIPYEDVRSLGGNILLCTPTRAKKTYILLQSGTGTQLAEKYCGLLSENIKDQVDFWSGIKVIAKVAEAKDSNPYDWTKKHKRTAKILNTLLDDSFEESKGEELKDDELNSVIDNLCLYASCVYDSTRYGKYQGKTLQKVSEEKHYFATRTFLEALKKISEDDKRIILKGFLQSMRSAVAGNLFSRSLAQLPIKSSPIEQKALHPLITRSEFMDSKPDDSKTIQAFKCLSSIDYARSYIETNLKSLSEKTSSLLKNLDTAVYWFRYALHTEIQLAALLTATVIQLQDQSPILSAAEPCVSCEMGAPIVKWIQKGHRFISCNLDNGDHLPEETGLQQCELPGHFYVTVGINE